MDFIADLEEVRKKAFKKLSCIQPEQCSTMMRSAITSLKGEMGIAFLMWKES
jgi:hypothetical protein